MSLLVLIYCHINLLTEARSHFKYMKCYQQFQRGPTISSWSTIVTDGLKLTCGSYFLFLPANKYRHREDWYYVGCGMFPSREKLTRFFCMESYLSICRYTAIKVENPSEYFSTNTLNLMIVKFDETKKFCKFIDPQIGHIKKNSPFSFRVKCLVFCSNMWFP